MSPEILRQAASGDGKWVSVNDSMTDKAQISQEHVVATLRRLYSEAVVDHVLHPRNLGGILQADGIGSITEGDCGDTLTIWLRVRRDVVDQASFWTDGCAASMACGSMAVELTEGRSVAEVLQLAPEDILDALGGLPEANAHCAVVATKTLKLALRDYLRMKNEPWKRAYRK